MRTVALIAILLVAGCGCASAPTGSATPGSATTAAPATAPVVAAPTIDVSALGDPCSAEGTCAEGVACVEYYGFAGEKGPAFRSCEVRCHDDDECPEGATCGVIADGPGNVCRPPANTR